MALILLLAAHLAAGGAAISRTKWPITILAGAVLLVVLKHLGAFATLRVALRRKRARSKAA